MWGKKKNTRVHPVISGETIGKNIDGIDGEILDVIPLGINWGFYMVLINGIFNSTTGHLVIFKKNQLGDLGITVC